MKQKTPQDIAALCEAKDHRRYSVTTKRVAGGIRSILDNQDAVLTRDEREQLSKATRVLQQLANRRSQAAKLQSVREVEKADS